MSGSGCDSCLSISTVATRANAVVLDGSSCSGNIYVFYNSVGFNVKRVNFYVDDTTFQDGAVVSSNLPPFDLVANGTTANAELALPFDTCALTNGQHTISAVVLYANNTQVITSAKITVNNTGCKSPLLNAVLGADLTIAGVAPVFNLLSGLLFVDLQITVGNIGTLPSGPLVFGCVGVQVGSLVGVNANVQIGDNLSSYKIIPSISAGQQVTVSVQFPCRRYVKVLAMADVTANNIQLNVNNDGQAFLVNCNLLQIILGELVPQLVSDISQTLDDITNNLAATLTDLLNLNLPNLLQDVTFTVDQLLGDVTTTVNNLTGNLALGLTSLKISLRK